MFKRSVSAQDVAVRAGVSRTTVSFVLNNAPGKIISEATRRRVLAAAAELGYSFNTEARNLALTRHHSIGLFICHTHSVFSDAFLVGLIEGVSKVLNKHRLRLVLQPVRLEQGGYLALARRDSLDGMILVNAHDGDAGLEEVIATQYPLAVVGSVSDDRVAQVDIDNYSAAREVTSYLTGLGHRRVAMIVHAPLVYNAAVERLRGFRDALGAAGLAAEEAPVGFGDFTEESGCLAMRELLRARPTAVFAGNDMIAYGAIKAIRDAGLDIPSDISIAGFDDDYLSRYLNPPLTTMALPAASLGAEAARLVIERLSGPGLCAGRRRSGRMAPQGAPLAAESSPGAAGSSGAGAPAVAARGPVVRLSPHLAQRSSCAPPLG